MKTRTIFQCREFEPVDVPLDLLLARGGVDIYPEVAGRGYFDIDYRNGQIVLAAKSYVGLIPINDRIAVHVLPRFSIANLYYVLRRTEAKLRFVDRFLRSFEQSVDQFEEPNLAFGRRLLRLLPHLQTQGLLRRYESRRRHSALGSGEILFAETVSSYRSKGIRHRSVWSENRLTANLRENQLIKAALYKVMSFLSTFNSAEHLRLRADAGALWRRFDDVSEKVEMRGLDQWLPGAIRGLPLIHQPYVPALWLAYVLVAGRAISLERIGSAVFDTFLINASDVFEDYVRILVREVVAENLSAIEVKNGNEHPVPLFLSASQFTVKPDIYLLRNDQALGVLDAKYKLDIKAQDRYEILSFCEALRCKTAIAVLPGVPAIATELVGETAGGVKFYKVFFNMAAASIAEEEARFKSSILGLLH